MLSNKQENTPKPVISYFSFMKSGKVKIIAINIFIIFELG